jgi:hypothetical protein
MRIRSVSIVALVLAPGLVACGGASKTAPSARTAAVVVSPSGQAVSAAYVAAGTPFDARLDRAIDTRTSAPGEPITATVTEPIRASDGKVIVPQGTQFEGHIAFIDRLNGPRIGLEFDDMVLGHSRVPVAVQILSVQQSRYESSSGAPSGVTNVQPGAPQRPSTTAPMVAQIAIPEGAALRLALTRPIVRGE